MAQQLSTPDESALVNGLYAVFSLVAGADREVDAAERARFEQMLRAASQGEEPVRSLCQQALARVVAGELEALGSAQAALDAVHGAAQVAQRVWSAEAALGYRRGLYAMGQALAGASGGGSLRVRASTSGVERSTLAELARCLELG